MRNTLMLTLALLISAICLPAQGKDKSKDKDLETMEGCLQRSAGQYNLIDDTNTIYHLEGGAAKLKPHVGHQVEITGKPGVRTIDTTPPGTASAAVVVSVFEVKSVKHIADTCK